MRYLRLVMVSLLIAGTVPIACAEDEVPHGWTRITRDGHFKQRPAWSPDGKQLLFTRHVNESIHVIRCDADGRKEQRLFENQYPRMDAVYSADGKRLAFTFDKVSPGQGDMELYLAGADGGNLQPLFVTAGKLSHEEWASWAPDGKSLVCTSTRDDNAELYLLTFDGEPPQRLTSDPAFDLHPAFSPDGNLVAFATNRWGDFEIAIYNLRTSLITRLTETPGVDDFPAWSPDGRQIAWMSNQNGDRDIWLMSTDGSRPHNLTRREGHDQFPTWTPDGEVTFVSFIDGEWDIYRTAP